MNPTTPLKRGLGGFLSLLFHGYLTTKKGIVRAKKKILIKQRITKGWEAFSYCTTYCWWGQWEEVQWSETYDVHCKTWARGTRNIAQQEKVWEQRLALLQSLWKYVFCKLGLLITFYTVCFEGHRRQRKTDRPCLVKLSILLKNIPRITNKQTSLLHLYLWWCYCI